MIIVKARMQNLFEQSRGWPEGLLKLVPFGLAVKIRNISQSFEIFSSNVFEGISKEHDPLSCKEIINLLKADYYLFRERAI